MQAYNDKHNRALKKDEDVIVRVFNYDFLETNWFFARSYPCY